MGNKLVRFICKRCGKQVAINKHKYSGHYCRKCKMQLAYSNEEMVNEANEKRKQTNIEKYGVDNPQKLEEVREKTKQTNIEKYGTEYTFNKE